LWSCVDERDVLLPPGRSWCRKPSDPPRTHPSTLLCQMPVSRAGQEVLSTSSWLPSRDLRSASSDRRGLARYGNAAVRSIKCDMRDVVVMHEVHRYHPLATFKPLNSVLFSKSRGLWLLDISDAPSITYCSHLLIVTYLAYILTISGCDAFYRNVCGYGYWEQHSPYSLYISGKRLTILDIWEHIRRRRQRVCQFATRLRWLRVTMSTVKSSKSSRHFPHFSIVCPSPLHGLVVLVWDKREV